MLRSRATVSTALSTALGLALMMAPAAAQSPIKWSGLYIGAHGGWASADIDFPGAPPHPVGPPRQTLEGAVIGGHIGYNLQLQQLVLGIEADLSWGNLIGTVRDGNYLTETQSVDWSGSVRGRVGLAFGGFLPYLTAGIMWDRASAGASCPDPAAVFFGNACKLATTGGAYDLSDTQTHMGFVWGGGFELAMGQKWSLKVEALFADMGDASYQLPALPNGNVPPPFKVEHDYTVVRGGFSVKLN
jgi:outer membrane immunogenic protein